MYRFERVAAATSASSPIVTLWCAVIAKATRGVTKLLPKQMTPLQFRLLAQLTLPESERVLPMRAARLLVLKPADVDEAVAFWRIGIFLGSAMMAASS